MPDVCGARHAKACLTGPEFDDLDVACPSCGAGPGVSCPVVEVDDSGSDAELAWSNIGGSVRVFRHVWRGLARASETGSEHLHPTQKPIALSEWIFRFAKLKPGDLVFVPYLGSGPDLPAARAMGLRIICCDVEEWCCRTAISRLGAVTVEEAAKPVGPLFGARA